MWFRFAWISLSLLIAAALPLLHPIGRQLEYEYTFLVGILAAILPSLGSIVLPFKKLAPTPVPPAVEKWPSGLLWTLFVFAVAPVLLTLPGLVMFFSDHCQCSRMGFLFWITIIDIPAAALGVGLFFVFWRARCIGISRLKISLALVGIWALGFLHFAAEMWFAPQKRAVDMFMGFVHGPIYDDAIQVDPGIAVARMSHLFAALLLMSLALVRRRWINILKPAVFATLWLGAAIFASKMPSVQHGAKALQVVLPGVLPGQGFTLHFKPKEALKDGKATAEVSPVIERLFRESSFHVQELKQIMALPDAPHVHIYVYPDADSKKLWFGGGGTDLADVVTPSIHITESAEVHANLRHELVHALASKIAYKGLGFHPNMAFTEGLAMALAPTEKPLTLDEGAASLLSSGKVSDPAVLFDPVKFWTESSSRAYTMAGSMISFLIATHGVDAVKRLYGGQSWQKAVGESSEQFLAAWEKKIQTGYDPERTRIITESMYRYPGILHDLCPHTKADLRRGRDESIYVRLRQPVGWDPGRDYLSWLLELDPQDLATKYAIWSKEIKKLAEDRFTSAEKLTTWRSVMQGSRAAPPKVYEDVQMALTESDLARVAGDMPASVQILQDLTREAKNKPVGDGLLRQIVARDYVDKMLPAGEALEWRRYLAEWRKTPPERSDDDLWLLTYLRLRRGEREFDQAAYLSGLLITPVDTTLPATFQTEWYRLLGHRLFNLGVYQHAADAYDFALKQATPGQAELYSQYVRLAKFAPSVAVPTFAAPKTAQQAAPRSSKQ